ncbi:MAG: cytochrome c biogenesis protein CcsA [Acidobacteria bacterium]|nr:cytochrome c biogenesis protein CcsA [Acidobacteriota bacterium]
MGQTSVFWLRVALALYSLGLWHALLTVIRRRQRLLGVALASFCVAAVFQLVSIVEEGFALGRFPVANIHQSASVVGLLITLLFLAVYWRYKYESLAVFIFPIVFVCTLIASLGHPVEPWSSPVLRSSWLFVHVVLALLGYAALFVTCVAAVMYLIQERELKSRKPRAFYYRLPPLGALDDLAYKTLAIGFVLITLGLITGSFWALVEWGTRWVVDPKIILAFVTWGIYLLMIFTRWTIGWRGRKAAYFAIVGFCCAALTWIVDSGVHSFVKR